MSSTAPISTTGTNTLSKRSVKRCVGEICSCASATIFTIRANVLSPASLVTSTTSAPSPLIVPANTLSSGCFSTGIDSPVTGAWLTAELPDTTCPSAGSRCPGLTITRSPRCNSSTGTSVSTLSRCTMAVLGASSASASIALRARSIAMCSSAWPILNRNSSSAPSSHAPKIAAPPAATIIKLSISKRRLRIPSHASCTV